MTIVVGYLDPAGKVWMAADTRSVGGLFIFPDKTRKLHRVCNWLIGLSGPDRHHEFLRKALSFESIEKIRDRAALADWLAPTAQRECIRVLRTQRPQPSRYVPDAGDVLDDQSGTAKQELLAAEHDAALREALARLPEHCQRLIALLCADPSMPYAEISTRLGVTAGSIGPDRGRCLEKLRRDPAIAALIGADPGTARW